MFRNEEEISSGWKIVLVLFIFYIIMMLISLGTTKLQKNDFERWNLLLLFFQQIVLITVTIFVWKKIIKCPLYFMGLKSIIKHKKELIVGLLLGGICITIVFWGMIISKSIVIKSWRPNISVNILIYFILFSAVGISEEIFGRGYVMSCLRQTRDTSTILFLSSAIFTILHIDNYGINLLAVINISLAGLLFAYMYLKSANIWMGIGFHIMWNYFQGAIYGFPVSGLNIRGIFTVLYTKNNLINGGTFGPEGGILVTIVLLISMLTVKYFYYDKSINFIDEAEEIE